MNRMLTWGTGLALAGLLAGCGQAAAVGRAANAAAGSSWGRVIGVPGLSALVKGNGGGTQVSLLSCASAGNCAAGGFYAEKDGRSQGFVAFARNGRWGNATGVPGLAALDKGGRPTAVSSVSCVPAGGCAAGGAYTGRSRHNQGFVTQGS